MTLKKNNVGICITFLQTYNVSKLKEDIIVWTIQPFLMKKERKKKQTSLQLEVFLGTYSSVCRFYQVYHHFANSRIIYAVRPLHCCMQCSTVHSKYMLNQLEEAEVNVYIPQGNYICTYIAIFHYYDLNLNLILESEIIFIFFTIFISSVDYDVFCICNNISLTSQIKAHHNYQEQHTKLSFM